MFISEDFDLVLDIRGWYVVCDEMYNEREDHVSAWYNQLYLFKDSGFKNRGHHLVPYTINS